jgi:hypothetical protein
VSKAMSPRNWGDHGWYVGTPDSGTLSLKLISHPLQSQGGVEWGNGSWGPYGY